MAYPVLAFTAEQIDEIKAAARHVPHHLRGDYLEAVAAALTGRDFGDGDVHRAIVRASVRIMGIMRRDSEHSRSRRKHLGPNSESKARSRSDPLLFCLRPTEGNPRRGAEHAAPSFPRKSRNPAAGRH